LFTLLQPLYTIAAAAAAAAAALVRTNA